MPPFDIAGLTFFIIILFVGLYLTVFALPGTVLIFLDVLGYALFTGFDPIGGRMLAYLLILSILAEGLEFLLGVAGIDAFPISKKSLIASVIGSIAGALFLTPWLYGLGTLAGIFLGGLLGLLLTEFIRQNHLKPALRAGKAAVLGRTAGTLAKGSLAMVMVVMTLMSVYS